MIFSSSSMPSLFAWICSKVRPIEDFYYGVSLLNSNESQTLEDVADILNRFYNNPLHLLSHNMLEEPIKTVNQILYRGVMQTVIMHRDFITTDMDYNKPYLYRVIDDISTGNSGSLYPPKYSEGMEPIYHISHLYFYIDGENLDNGKQLLNLKVHQTEANLENAFCALYIASKLLYFASNKLNLEPGMIRHSIHAFLKNNG